MCRKPSRSSGWRRRDGGWYAWTWIRRPRRQLVDDDRVGVRRQLVAAVPHCRTGFGFVVHRQCGRHDDVVVPRNDCRRRMWRWRVVMVDAVCKQVGLSTACRSILAHLCPYIHTTDETAVDCNNYSMVAFGLPIRFLKTEPNWPQNSTRKSCTRL